jgi:hypothetical protein
LAAAWGLLHLLLLYLLLLLLLLHELCCIPCGCCML